VNFFIRAFIVSAALFGAFACSFGRKDIGPPCARASRERTVFTQETIQNSGLTRLGDIFLLLDSWRVSTTAGFDWKASANGLAPFQGQLWTLLLDGQKVDLNVFGTNNLNLLPVTLDQIDSVVVVSVPRIDAGEFADRGLIHIYTHRPPPGVSFRGSLMGGNETGDPGPYRYTQFRSPNIDAIGPDASYTLGFSYGHWHVLGNLATQIHFFQDPAMQKRNKQILQLTSLHPSAVPPPGGGRTVQSLPGRFGFDEVFPGMRRVSASLETGVQSDLGRFDAFLGYSHAHRYFLFFQPLGREIPVDNDYLHTAVSGSVSPSLGMNLLFRGKFSSNTLSEYPNALAADFDWDRRVLALNLEGDYVRGPLQVIGGGLLRRVALETNAALDKESYNFGSVYGSAGCDILESLHETFSLAGVFCGGEAALKTALSGRWRVNAGNVLSLHLAYSERLFEEDNSIWYWTARGYDILDSLSVGYTIDGSIGKSRMLSSDLEWRTDVFDPCAGAVAVSYRRFEDVYVERQTFAFDTTSCSFFSPVVVETGNEGDVIGVNVSADMAAPASLQHHFFYSYQSAVAGDDAFKDVWETVPEHHAGYRFIYSPSAGFRLWGMLSYLSSSFWPDYSEIDGKTCTSNLSSTTYHASVKSSTVLDLELQKWFWHRRIRGDFICRNVWNEELRYHPIGASFDLTFYLQLKLFFSSGG